jgi:ClpP class serine protease
MKKIYAMNYYSLKSLLTSPWQVDLTTFTTYYPILRGIFNGLVIGTGKEDQNSLPFTEKVLNSAGGKNNPAEEKYVQVIPVRGVMMKHDMACGPAGMRTIGQRLVNGEKQKNVAGSILLFESGGGQSTAVPELTDAIAECNKPVVAYVDGIACSAAMYAASYCREIIASRETDIVGSIGTMISIEDFEKFGKDQNGMVHVRIYADGSEDKNGEFEKALTGDFKLIKESILNPTNETFKADIKRNRPKVTDEHLTGKSFKAKDVLGVLVDSVNSFQWAVNRVAELAELAEKEGKNIANNFQTNILTMNKLPLLLAALALTDLQLQDGQATLTEEQLEKIEAALNKSQTELQTANASLQTTKTELQTANSRIEILEKELNKKPGAQSADEAAGKSGETSNTDNETFYGRFLRMQQEMYS